MRKLQRIFQFAAIAIVTVILIRIAIGLISFNEIMDSITQSVGEKILNELFPASEFFTRNEIEVVKLGDKMEADPSVVYYKAPDINGEEVKLTLSDNVISNTEAAGRIYKYEDLCDYNFLMSNFYIVPAVTTLGSDKLRAKEFIDKDLSIEKDKDKPQILIFHTHSQETFADSIEGDDTTSILGVGDYLSQLLSEKYGYNVIHDRSVYDYVDGKLDRSKAYTYAENSIARIIEENPSIEVVIDLHRDGVADDMHLVTEVNGKNTANVMFFNGISYSDMNGDIEYLYNPNRDDNLATSLQMQLLGEAYYPGLLRRIYINAYRYCLHFRGRSMLIEAGAQTNTVEEVKNAMEPIADMLDKLLSGKKVIN